MHHTVQTFCDSMTNDIDTALPTQSKNKSNLTKHEKEALKQFKTRTDIIITNADKCGSVVIQDVTDYITAANRQLNNKTFYKKT